MTRYRRYEGRAVVVTGAAAGIGLGIAARFAGEGADVLLLDRSAAVEEAAAKVAAETSTRTFGVRADVTSPDDVTRAFDLAERTWGRLDVLVNNAGVITISRLEDLTLDDWQRVLAVNTTGTFLCAQAAAAIMRRHGGGGRILNAASGQARQGFVFTPHYAASKFGVVGLTQSLAKELAKDGITVNAYCPGIVGSDMWDYNDREWGRLLGDYGPGELMAEWVAAIPLGRAGTSDDVANLLLFLASDDAAYITGQAINIDGGMFMS
jgi:meso-butanediol dehydrogenase / (S,S)-butanediol dehydrogenase / diacetyl reductase